MLNDLRFAFRMIATHRWFSAAVVVTLALGIGINTTVFTLVNAVLIKPVPIPGGERLVTVSHQGVTEPDHRWGVAYPDFLEYRAQNRTFEGLEACENDEVVISEPGNPPERFSAGYISPGMFGMLRTPPLLGRGFTPGDATPGGGAVVLLGYGAWRNRYAGARDIVGRVVRLAGAPATIIGVMPEGCEFPNNQQLWLPLVPTAARMNREHRSLQLFGLLRPGIDLAQARGDLAVISARLAKEFPATNRDRVALVRTFHQTYNDGPIRIIFLTMLGAVGFVLLIACANVANMMLSRSIGRTRELSIRAAMGASRWQLVRQLLVESVLLSLLGGLLGLGLSTIGVHAFDLATRDVGKPFWIQFTMDWVALAYFGAVSVASGLVFGLLPALRASRIDLNTALKDGTPGGGHPRTGRLAGALVAGQFALTAVLLAGAGLMMRNFFAAQQVNAFVPAAQVLTAHVSLPDGKGERYEAEAPRRRFHDALQERLATLPGVTHVALASHAPGLGATGRDLQIEGRPNPNPKQPPRGSVVIATPGYFATIGLPVLSGRGFAAQDGEPGRETAVVTRAFAERYWPGESSLGRRFQFVPERNPAVWITVVGVCGDIIFDTSEQNPPPLVYLSNRQEPWAWLTLLVRTDRDATALAGPVRAAVQELDQDLPLFEARTLSAALEHHHWFLTVFGSLFLTFALAALVMASVGIYAVVAQNTALRTREIGIRMALGATATRVVGLVMSRGLLHLGIGLTLGLAGALAATRLLDTIVGLVSSRDPVLYFAVTIVLAATGLVACWLPASRAAAVHPVEALRQD